MAKWDMERCAPVLLAPIRELPLWSAIEELGDFKIPLDKSFLLAIIRTRKGGEKEE